MSWLRPWAGFLVLLLACGPGPQAELETRHEYTRLLLGTTFTLVLDHGDEAHADAVAEAAFARVEQLDLVLSDYKPESEVRRLGQTQGVAVPVSGELHRVLLAAEDLSRACDGAFDVTVGPYSALWRRARRQGEPPAPSELAAVAPSVGHALVTLVDPIRADAAPATVTLEAEDMALDLGGIAKGFILDEVLAVCVQAGIERALVDAGGDVALGLPPTGRDSWRVGVEGRDAPILALHSRAVATSGDAYQHLEHEGLRLSHIIDPRTGWALTGRAGATVVAPTAMLADGLASALCVLEPEAGLALVDDSPGTEARITREVDGELVVWTTDGFDILLVEPGSPD